jgi:hypothetical protein
MNKRDEETLRNLPEILDGIVTLDGLESPNSSRPSLYLHRADAEDLASKIIADWPEPGWRDRVYAYSTGDGIDVEAHWNEEILTPNRPQDGVWDVDRGSWVWVVDGGRIEEPQRATLVDELAKLLRIARGVRAERAQDEQRRRAVAEDWLQRLAEAADRVDQALAEPGRLWYMQAVEQRRSLIRQAVDAARDNQVPYDQIAVTARVSEQEVPRLR